MSDAAQPTAAEVRAAAEAVKAALDRHLEAVENRTGDDDPAVYAAFNDLAAAAEAYDERLYDRYDEVTPFEIPGVEDSLPPYEGPEQPSALSVLIRRDYAVSEPLRLLAQAQRIADADRDEDDRAGANAVVGTSVHAALGVLFGEFEPDEIASRHKEFGLEEGDSTLWVAAADELPEPGEWLSTPFDQADPGRVVCRFDVSSVFDEDELYEGVDDELDDEDEGAEDAEDAEDLYEGEEEEAGEGEDEGDDGDEADENGPGAPDAGQAPGAGGAGGTRRGR
ncbi:hypothetical protein NX801_10625 [Streptomyces sp. LP05-1]|uniref:Uncharacterized protein n=1 Tax=Streptomyces pyxinae TaxID=2970734 RepID=A0ABT2CHB4_9ACTN|nr:hypothetical protein [Streptomyces sp. LP05-1]MCS0636106.1 hypothetical protein [Streptomyces sp. LP05-1]